MSSTALNVDSPFNTLSALIAEHAVHRSEHPALIEDDRQVSYQALHQAMDKVAFSLQQQGLKQGQAIAICAANSINYALVFLGALRAGLVVAPLAPSSTAQSLQVMLSDSNAQLLFVDQASEQNLNALRAELPALISLDNSNPACAFDAWLKTGTPAPVNIEPTDYFNIIYSSGTTGEPKGIVQSHGMRWAHIVRGEVAGYGPNCVTLLSTPLYSNTTLVSFFPTLGFGGSLVVMSKFDALKFLQLAQRYRATHSMLVPVQYQRLMSHPEFDRFDLSSFIMKFSTSAPFHAELKHDILTRWSGGLIEFYGMTEGGGSCVLAAHEYPEKLGTVGKPIEGHDMRVIDEDGHELAVGEIGEVVGHSPAMMAGYLNKPEKTAEAEWYDASGKRFIRTGDVGRFDEDGFLTLMDRRKDMIISGGFNIYPSDLEAELRQHPALADVTVIGAPSTSWGETPVGYGVLKAGSNVSAEEIAQWFNQRVGKTQRLNRFVLTDELPRSAIGKVLKRELRDAFFAEHGTLA